MRTGVQGFDTGANRPHARGLMTNLRADGLSYDIDGERILDRVSLDVASGETIAIVGPSGAGKSSLLRLCNRLDEPTEGTVYLDGTDYRTLPPERLRKRVGLVPQNPALRGGTVRENVTIGPRLRGESVSEERLAAVLDAVGLADYADRDASDLSGGEAQRVAIARTVINDPEVLLLDEPTASLDSAAEAEVERLLADLLASGERTVVLVTHDERQAERLADRVARMADGRIVAVGTPREVIT
jgi:putative ABC transport system ATP-binding protein